MKIKTRTRTRTTHSAEIDGAEVELTFAPYYEDDILAERVGDQLVVAYLVQDSDPQNPMTDGDYQGNIYTESSRGWGGGSITDNDSELQSALGVDGYGNPDIDNMFACEPYISWTGLQVARACLRDIAAKQYLETVGADYNLIDGWLDQRDLELDEGETLDQAFNERRNEIWQDLEDPNGVYCDEVEKLATELYPQYWQQIAGPFVVPLDYCSSNHGPGTASFSVTSWDGDPEDLPSGVWVADKGAIDNITPYPPGVSLKQVVNWPEPSVYAVLQGEAELFRGPWSDCRGFIKKSLPAPTEADLRAAAEKYAESICSAYQDWCNGEVFGCVTEIFNLVEDEGDGPQWESEGDHDACWGFIGHDHAEETLQSEYFDNVVADLKKKAPPTVERVKVEDTEGGSCD